jgi:hypothetical protein
MVRYHGKLPLRAATGSGNSLLALLLQIAAICPPPGKIVDNPAILPTIR